MANEIEQAALLMAMLNGEVPEAYMNNNDFEEEDDEEHLEEDETPKIIIEFEDDEPRKKSRKKAKKVEESKKIETIPEDYRFGKRAEITVHLVEHEIHYKEQHWPIPARDIIYYVDRMDMTTAVVNLAKDLYKDKMTKEYEEKVRAGLVRFYKIVTYNTVPSRITTLGYVEVLENGSFNSWMNTTNGNKEHVDMKDAVKKAVKAVRELVNI